MSQAARVQPPKTDVLSAEQIESFKRDGILLQESLFSPDEVRKMSDQTELEFAVDEPRRTLEERTGQARGVHGSQLYTEYFGRLVRLPRLLYAARQLLGDDVYIHQFKINAKRAFVGDVWEWHQDFHFWHTEDGMPAPRALTAAVFLDEVNEFNGPLVFTPGAHTGDTADAPAKAMGWESTLTADLKYKIDTDTIKGWVDANGMVAPKGPAGSVLWFGSNIPHASVRTFRRSTAGSC